MAADSGKRESAPRGTALEILAAAALSIPTLRPPAHSQTAPAPAAAKLQFSWYRDFQDGGEDRMKVVAPSFWVRSPLTKDTELEGFFVVDSMSGASPLYLDSLSGASGLGVEDDRQAGTLKATKFFDRFAVSLGGAASHEDDYVSRGISAETRIWTPDRNVVFTFGVGVNHDEITSSILPGFEDSRATVSAISGVSFVINRVSAVQTSLTYSTADGYISDPYKPFDLRPRSRDSWAWLSRYLLYLEATGGSLHLDYRLFADSWGILAHTTEASVHQPIGEGWLLTPMVRYYTQGGADFFRAEYPPLDDGFYSADQRLSSFGSVSAGLRIMKELSGGYSVDVAYERIHQDGDLKGGGGGTGGLSSFGAELVTVGLTKRF